MPRKRINEKAPLTNAEKQRRYRANQKAKLESLKAAADGGAAPDRAAMRETIKAELKTSWEPEARKERMREARQQARQRAKQADVNFDHGRYFGIIQAATYFIGKDRADITRALLSYYCIDRELAERILQDDKRTKSLSLASLDRVKAWGKPPPDIK